MKINNAMIESIENYHYKQNKGEHEVNAQERARPREVSRDEINDIVKRLNKTFDNENERITFSYHEKTNRIIIKVLDSKTNEVLREIPPKDILKLVENIQQYLGILYDESR